MNDSYEASAQGPGRWVILIARVPAAPDYLRVKLRRRLLAIGAIALRNAVYVLPNRDDCVEDFLWLHAELLQDGADAMIFVGTSLASPSDDELEAAFRQARDLDYEALLRDAAERGTEASRPRERTRLAERFASITRIDFFGASRRRDAERAIAAL